MFPFTTWPKKHGNVSSPCLPIEVAETEADARAKILVYFLENRVLSPTAHSQRLLVGVQHKWAIRRKSRQLPALLLGDFGDLNGANCPKDLLADRVGALVRMKQKHAIALNGVLSPQPSFIGRVIVRNYDFEVHITEPTILQS